MEIFMNVSQISQVSGTYSFSYLPCMKYVRVVLKWLLQSTTTRTTTSSLYVSVLT